MSAAADMGRLALIMFIASFIMGMGQGVNNWGHAGGFIGGYLVAEVLMSSVHKREGPAELALAGAVLLATVGGVALSFVKTATAVLGH